MTGSNFQLILFKWGQLFIDFFDISQKLDHIHEITEKDDK